MPEPYRIDYDNPDVEAIVRQIRERAAATAEEPLLPAAPRGGPLERLREYVQLDDDAPYDIQDRLGLSSGWNVLPEDLRASHPGAIGRLIRAVRTLLRPVTKLLVNTDRPIFKQFKINLGLAAAVLDLLTEQARLARRLREMETRLARLEGGGDRHEPGPPPGGTDAGA